jgi:hypothetical protein
MMRSAIWWIFLGFVLLASSMAPSPASAMNGVTSISAASSCSASTEGTFRYNSTNTTIEFCNGSNWKALSTTGSSSASVTDSVFITGSSSCNSGTAGAIYYNSTSKALQYCNGSVWQTLSTSPASGSGTIGSAGVGHPACATGTAGLIRYNAASGALELCGGSTWATFTTTPPAFSFTNQTGVAANSAISSNAVTLSGFFGPLTATCNAGCTGIARNGSWGGTSVSGFVSGDTIAIRQTSSAAGNVTTTATVTAGNTVSGVWSVTSLSAAKIVFLSSVVGSMSIGAFDNACQNDATAAGLAGVYKAWVSTSTTDARDRVALTDIKYQLPNGTVIANNKADLLDGTLYAPINILANGSATTDTAVYTSTQIDGTKASTDPNYMCADWTNGQSSFTYRAYLGNAQKSDNSWTRPPGDAGYCDWAWFARVYCFPQ